MFSDGQSELKIVFFHAFPFIVEQCPVASPSVGMQELTTLFLGHNCLRNVVFRLVSSGLWVFLHLFPAQSLSNVLLSTEQLLLATAHAMGGVDNSQRVPAITGICLAQAEWAWDGHPQLWLGKKSLHENIPNKSAAWDDTGDQQWALGRGTAAPPALHSHSVQFPAVIWELRGLSWNSLAFFITESGVKQELCGILRVLLCRGFFLKPGRITGAGIWAADQTKPWREGRIYIPAMLFKWWGTFSGLLCRRKNFLFSFTCRSKIYSPAPTPHSLSLAPPSPARALCHLSQKYFFDILNTHKNFSLAELGVQWSLWDEKYLQVSGPWSHLEVWGESKFQLLQKSSQSPVAVCRHNKYSQFTTHTTRRRKAAISNVWHWSLSLCFVVLLFFFPPSHPV